MANNVLSWATVLAKGYQPGLYPYEPDKVPTGEYDAVLDFKIWAKKIMGISCYFTQSETEIKFQLTVYCTQKTGRYAVGEPEIDFTQCPVNQCYHVHVSRKENGKVILKNAFLLLTK